MSGEGRKNSSLSVNSSKKTVNHPSNIKYIKKAGGKRSQGEPGAMENLSVPLKTGAKFSHHLSSIGCFQTKDCCSQICGLDRSGIHTEVKWKHQS